MGRFYTYNGNFGPSDSYLSSHELQDFDPVNDYENDDYEVEDDEEVFLGTRICRECGQSFTLDELLSRFNEVMENQYHLEVEPYEVQSGFDDDLCPWCAAAQYMEDHPDDD